MKRESGENAPCPLPGKLGADRMDLPGSHPAAKNFHAFFAIFRTISTSKRVTLSALSANA